MTRQQCCFIAGASFAAGTCKGDIPLFFSHLKSFYESFATGENAGYGELSENGAPASDPGASVIPKIIDTAVKVAGAL